ncbi:MAG: thiol-disulfide oxidoreductase [Cyanobacteria bacterium PR.3.49]|nr:thiol-disulfide oxidoreductase [Cyanobacteria bacterium PR.3.49]
MPLRMDAALPSIEGGTEWFNSPPIKNDELKGTPVLIHFWAISCGICKESLPEISGWLDSYGSKGLKIVSVHMPRQETDTNIEAVKEAIEEYQVKQPCVVDNWHEITDGFENKYVPAFYLFDEEGKMRQFNAGEKAAKLVESAIERVLNAYAEKQGAKA